MPAMAGMGGRTPTPDKCECKHAHPSLHPIPSPRTEFVDEVLHVRPLGHVRLVEPALVLALLAAHGLEGVVVPAVVRQGLVLELHHVRGHL